MAFLKPRQEALPEKLQEWVVRGLSQGHSSEEIASQLKEAGYTDAQIAGVMANPAVRAKVVERLIAWVAESLRRGRSREEVAQQLKGTGYSKKQISHALSDKRVRMIVPDELTRWVTEGLKGGYSPGEIKQQLFDAGYTHRQVGQAFSQPEVRRASKIWTGKDSVPRHEVPPGVYRGVAAAALVLFLGAFILNIVPVSTTLWPSYLAAETGLREEAAVPLTSEKALSAVIAFKPGERHTLDIRASCLDISRLDLEIDGAKVASADISSHEPEVYRLRFTPEKAVGLLTLKSDGDIIVYKLIYKRPRKLFGSR